MRVVTAGEVDAALVWPALIEALRAAFAGGPVAPARHHHAIERPGAAATLLLMPAWTAAAASASFVGTKIVTVYPENGRRALPSVQGTYLLLDGTTGTPLAAMDGARLTLWRTAAASALAAGYLARADARRMAVVGAGALAPFLVRAHASIRPLSHVAVWARRPETAAALAAELAGAGLPAEPAADLEGAVRDADLVSCATLSNEPLVRGAWLRPGCHLDLVGAFSLAMREADNAALLRAAVHVDTPACLTEGGDVAVAIRDGVIDPSHVRGDLADLVAGRALGRTGADEITLFKSIGASIEDLAAAVLVWQGLAPEREARA